MAAADRDSCEELLRGSRDPASGPPGARRSRVFSLAPDRGARDPGREQAAIADHPVKDAAEPALDAATTAPCPNCGNVTAGRRYCGEGGQSRRDLNGCSSPTTRASPAPTCGP